MQIYLVRHAHALAGEDDAARPLGRKGRAQVRHVGAFLRRRGLLEVKEVWHSPLVRSRDTARRLVRQLKSGARLVEVARLLHEDDPAIMARRLAAVRRPVAVVGHEPHLGALASRLVAGRAHPTLFRLRKAAVLALERSGRRWVVRWQVSPEVA